MAIIANITGSAWNTSGAASTGTTGLNVLTGTWTHVGSTDVPNGSSSTGYITLAEAAAGTFRIDSATTPFTGAETDHWIRFWVYAGLTGTLAADTTSGFIHTVTSSGTRLRTAIYVRNNTQRPGLNMLVSEFLTGGTTAHLDGLGTSLSPASIPFDQWVEIAIHIREHASDGRYAFYINGVLLGECSAIDTTATGGIASADLASNWTVAMPAIAGITWRLAPGIESWSGTDIHLRPRFELNSSTSSFQQRHFIHDIDTVYTQGRMLEVEAGNTATVAATKYATSGNNPRRKRHVISGASTNTATISTIDDVGSLVYNSQGWATICLIDSYFNGSPTASFSLRNEADDGDIVLLDIDGLDLNQGVTTLHTFTASKRYAIAIHLNQNGSARWSVYNLSDPFSTTMLCFSGTLNNWTPQNIGKVKVSVTLGSASVEVGAIDVCSWLDLVGIDSLTAGNTNALSPLLQSPNHLTAYLPLAEESMSIPGGMFPYKEEIDSSILDRFTMSIILGRSGGKRSDFTTNVIAGLENARGIRLWTLDGGSINDFGTITNTTERDTVVSGLSTNVEQMIDYLVPNGNSVVLTTMVRRESGTTFDALDHQAADLFSDEIRSLASTKQQNDLIFLMDPADNIADHSSLFTIGDDTHPNAAGSIEIVAKMFSSLVRLAAPIVESVISSSIFYGGYKIGISGNSFASVAKSSGQTYKTFYLGSLPVTVVEESGISKLVTISQDQASELQENFIGGAPILSGRIEDKWYVISRPTGTADANLEYFYKSNLLIAKRFGRYTYL